MNDETVTLDGRSGQPFMRRYGAGELLFREGDQDQRVFVLLEGRVSVMKENVPVVEIDVADSFIGEISALTKKPRWASAITLTACTLLVIERVEDMFLAGSDWGLKLAAVLARRLDMTNERLKRLQLLLQTTRSRDTDGTLVETLQIVVDDAWRDA